MKPEKIYLIVDTDHAEAADLHDAHGETVGDVPVVVERLRPGTSHCEGCDADPDGAYVLDGQSNRHGVPVCLPCLHSYEWVLGITTDVESLEREFK